MKYVKPFDEVLDWKTIHFIVDKMSYFEDKGYGVTLHLHTYQNERNFHLDNIKGLVGSLYDTQFQYRGGRIVIGNQWDKDVKNDCLNNRFVYSITLCDSNFDHVDLTTLISDFISLLSGKLSYVPDETDEDDDDNIIGMVYFKPK